MKKREAFIFGIIIIIIIAVAVPTIMTIINRHSNKLLEVTESKIKETAKSCYDKGECEKTEITLKELYDKNLLEEQSNPLTKEYYNENSYVLISDNEIKFIEVKD